MKEIVLTLCFMNPCFDIPNTDIIMVPIDPVMTYHNFDPDDKTMEWCDECKRHIKWVNIADPV